LYDFDNSIIESKDTNVQCICSLAPLLRENIAYNPLQYKMQALQYTKTKYFDLIVPDEVEDPWFYELVDKSRWWISDHTTAETSFYGRSLV